jgi:hypothetical protein
MLESYNSIYENLSPELRMDYLYPNYDCSNA